MRRNKYGVAPKHERTMDGKVFHSKAEMHRYAELQMLQRAGEISDLQMQVPYRLQETFNHPVHGRQTAIYYVADFAYIEANTGRRVVEDVKGAETQVYRLKKRLLLHAYPDIDFREIKSRR